MHVAFPSNNGIVLRCGRSRALFFDILRTSKPPRRKNGKAGRGWLTLPPSAFGLVPRRYDLKKGNMLHVQNRQILPVKPSRTGSHPVKLQSRSVQSLPAVASAKAGVSIPARRRLGEGRCVNLWLKPSPVAPVKPSRTGQAQSHWSTGQTHLIKIGS